MIKSIIVASLFILVHDPHAEDLDDWYRSLTNKANGSCCDGSDAFSVNDPDWEVNLNDNYPFKVKIKLSDGTKTDWILVYKDNVVKQQNITGAAKVWPLFDRNGVTIRCFMPGNLI